MTRIAILTKALETIAAKGGREVIEDGQVVEYDGKPCATIARQALREAKKQTPEDSKKRV